MPRVFKDRFNLLEELDDVEIVSRYRLNKDMIWVVTEIVKPDIEHPTFEQRIPRIYNRSLIS
jgi:hypothetical protein